MQIDIGDPKQLVERLKEHEQFCRHMLQATGRKEFLEVLRTIDQLLRSLERAVNLPSPPPEKVVDLDALVDTKPNPNSPWRQ